MLAELDGLRAGQTLGEWKASHPVETVERYGPMLSEQTNEGWCARVRSETSIDADRKARRDAYFYLPDPPTVMSMPAGTPDELLNQCRLGFVWAEIQDSDAARADRLADTTRESLASVLGTAQSNAKVHWWDAGAWRKTGLWKQNDLSVVTATTNSRRWRSEDRPIPRVLVAAAGGTSGITLEPYRPPTEIPEEHAERFGVIESRINEAIATAASGGLAEANVRRAMKILADTNPPWEYPSGANRTFILNAVNGWLASAPSSPPARRAATLFVADQILGESGVGWAKDENPSVRRQLEAHGAQFNWAPLGGRWVYAHALLKESLESDPDGRIGDLAFITLMEYGFETSGMCLDQGDKGFHAVINEGTAFLSRKPDSPFASYVHLTLAEAWGDVVTLANGGGYDQSVATDKTEEASARKRAIEEYRLAFTSLIQRPFKQREAWRNAWRLMAGLSPSRTYFYCVYD